MRRRNGALIGSPGVRRWDPPEEAELGVLSRTLMGMFGEEVGGPQFAKRMAGKLTQRQELDEVEVRSYRTRLYCTYSIVLYK